MFDSLLQSLIGWFSLPANGLSTVFVVSFASATLLPIAGHVAFYNENVDLMIDGVLQERPVTPFSNPGRRPTDGNVDKS